MKLNHKVIAGFAVVGVIAVVAVAGFVINHFAHIF